MFLLQDVPDSFKSCIVYLSQPHVLKEVGLFRVSGNATDVQRYSATLDSVGVFVCESASGLLLCV